MATVKLIKIILFYLGYLVTMYIRVVVGIVKRRKMKIKKYQTVFYGPSTQNILFFRYLTDFKFNFLKFEIEFVVVVGDLG